ncbi:MAG: hypothetical protein K9J13_13875 [Saprospiraceae bacterium]|nr:hypothetical protein [Saprospiraceae bacterium]
MRKARINSITNVDRVKRSLGKYQIYLGNEFFYFESHSKADKFQIKVNKYINEELENLNQKYISIHGIYRDNYFVIEMRQNNTIKMNLEIIQSSFELCLDRSGWENGSKFAFNHLSNITECLQNIIDTINSYCIKKHDYVTLRKLKIYDDELFRMQNNRSSFKRELRTKVTTIKLKNIA